MKITTLYRPVGKTELLLIAKSGFLGFPPRLDWQPIFYPVLDKKYAEQIALDWNVSDEFSGYVGFVTEFDLNSDHLQKYQVENVGAANHNELWIPAEELDVFNDNIVGEIRVVNAFFGSKFDPEGNDLMIELNRKFEK